MIYIIEGVDRLGKDTLIQNIIKAKGYHEVIHKGLPEALRIYNDDLETYQMASFYNMFEIVNDCEGDIIFNRGHLGECVYSPIYRGYSGEYVFELEKEADTSITKLILLYTSDFSFISDDGESLDVTKREEEQELFKAAFMKSTIDDKILIDVSNGKGGFKTPEEILNCVLYD